MKDKDVDDFLKELDSKEFQITGYESLRYFDKENPENSLKKLNISVNFDYLVNEIKLLKIISQGEISFFSLSKKGRKVMRVGGWLKYLDRRNEIENKKVLKEDYELKITKFQANNPRLPYYASFGGLIFSVLAFVNSCNSESKSLSDKVEMQPYNKEITILKSKKEDSTKVLEK